MYKSIFQFYRNGKTTTFSLTPEGDLEILVKKSEVETIVFQTPCVTIGLIEGLKDIRHRGVFCLLSNGDVMLCECKDSKWQVCKIFDRVVQLICVPYESNFLTDQGDLYDVHSMAIIAKEVSYIYDDRFDIIPSSGDIKPDSCKDLLLSDSSGELRLVFNGDVYLSDKLVGKGTRLISIPYRGNHWITPDSRLMSVSGGVIDAPLLVEMDESDLNDLIIRLTNGEVWKVRYLSPIDLNSDKGILILDSRVL